MIIHAGGMEVLVSKHGQLTDNEAPEVAAEARRVLKKALGMAESAFTTSLRFMHSRGVKIYPASGIGIVVFIIGSKRVYRTLGATEALNGGYNFEAMLGVDCLGTLHALEQGREHEVMAVENFVPVSVPRLGRISLHDLDGSAAEQAAKLIEGYLATTKSKSK